MNEARSLSLSGPEYATAIDLVGIANDLADVDRLLSMLNTFDANRMPQSEDDDLVCWALWVAAAIHYRRCFTSGRSLATGKARHRVDRLVEAGEREVHETMLRLADKHIAHQVSTEESSGSVEVWLAPQCSPGVESVCTATILLVGSDADFLRKASELVRELERRVSHLADAECDRWKRVLADRLDWLYAEAALQEAERVRDVEQSC